MPEQPLVSVIIPCYNHARFLTETLNSVLEQSYPNWECIMVDNGSTDNTSEIAGRFTNDKRFSFHRQGNHGVSHARNTAIRRSNGKYILPLDSDDKIGSGYIAEGVRILEADPLVKLVYCDAELFGEAHGYWNLPPYSIQNMLMENAIFCSAIYRRSDYNQTNGYDETMLNGFEDWDFWLSFLSDDPKVCKIPEVHFYYRIRKASRNNSLTHDEQLILRRFIYEKHREMYSTYLDIPEILLERFLLKEQLRKINISKEYRFGKALLNPLRKIAGKIRKRD